MQTTNKMLKWLASLVPKVSGSVERNTCFLRQIGYPLFVK